MGKSSDEQKRSWGTWSAALVVLLVLYVLSGPPARLLGMALFEAGYVDERIGWWFETIYAPLIWINQNSETFDKFYTWYGGLWPMPD
ncbi:MAG: hypothetical protein AB7O26_13325 [Planctomycetaceae bacterium]